MTEPETGEEPAQRREPSVADLQEPPPPPVEEEQPAAEHEAIAEPEPSHDEDERQAIAEQPTEHFDVAEELAGSSAPGPSDEELVEEEIAEPRLAPVDPLAAELEQIEEPEAEVTVESDLEDEDEEDEFWSEQRLSEELDQALDAPLDDSLADPAPLEEAEPLAEPAEAEEPEPSPEEPEEPAAPASADVLEDTPEFLEDAPEDDELWFEQKPPKDFDFDD